LKSDEYIDVRSLNVRCRIKDSKPFYKRSMLSETVMKNLVVVISLSSKT